MIVAFGGSAVLGHHLGLPVSDHLVEVQQDGSEKPLPGTKFYIPGSIMQRRGGQHQPARVRLREAGRRVLRQQPGDGARAERGAARREAGGVVRLEEAAALGLGVGPALSRWRHRRASKRQLGKGKVFLIGPEITFRAQPHGTFKFLFNSIFYGTAQAVGGPPAETAARGR